MEVLFPVKLILTDFNTMKIDFPPEAEQVKPHAALWGGSEKVMSRQFLQGGCVISRLKSGFPMPL